MEETSKVLHSEYSLVWFWNLDTSESGQKYLESFEMWCWRRMKKINWTNHVRTDVLQNIKDKRNILQTIKTRKTDWTGHILRRNGLSKTRYWRKGIRKDQSDGKKRKKT